MKSFQSPVTPSFTPPPFLLSIFFSCEYKSEIYESLNIHILMEV